MTELLASPFWISLKVSLVAALLASLLGLGSARLLARKRGRAWAFGEALLLSPLVVPPTVVGFGLLLLLGRNGWLGGFFERAFSVSLVFSWVGAAVAATVVSLPLMHMTARGALRQVDPELVGAARTLGLSATQAFLMIEIPLAWTGIASGFLLAFARALGEFGATLMVAGNLPGVTQTLPMAIYFEIEAGNTGRALLWTSVSLALSAGVLLLLNLLPGSDGPHRLEKRRLCEPAPKASHEENALLPLRSQGGFAKPHLRASLRKRWGAFELALDLEMERETLALLGPSGAGKSLALRLLAGLESPDAGEIILNGRTLYSSGKGIFLPPEQRGVGLIFQSQALFPHLTVRENVAFALAGPDRSPERIGRALRMVHLETLAEKHPWELSGGQRQRVALARALVRPNELLLFDEPFASLDLHLRLELERELAELLEGAPFPRIFVTHALDEAFRCAERFQPLVNGRSREAHPKRVLRDGPTTPEVARLLGYRNVSRWEFHAGHHHALDFGFSVPEGALPALAKANALALLPTALVLESGAPCAERQGWLSIPCRIRRVLENPDSLMVFVDTESAEGKGSLEIEMPLADGRRLAGSEGPWRVGFATSSLKPLA